MAERRMFAKTIIDSDAFLDMPMSTQALYFHLAMRADDDGFLNNPKKIQRIIGASDDDMRVLISKRFLIPFDSGVVVIKHWKIHNYIRNDRYKPTVYEEEKAQLTTKENGAYTLGIPSGIPNGYQMDTQVRIELGEDRVRRELGEENNNTSFYLSDEKISEIMSLYLDKIEPEPYPGHVDFIKASIQSKGADKVLAALKKCVEDGKTSFSRVVKAVNEA